MACSATEIVTDFGCFPNDPVGFVQKFYAIGLGFVAGIALIALIIGGYLILTSQGIPERVNNGKAYIFYAIIGLLLAIFGFVFIEVIVVNVLHVPGFK
jgi:cytochrome c biogenesis protein CcdA